MDERKLMQERCRNCPNRCRIAKVLGRLTRTDIAQDCDGPVKVEHGVVKTQVEWIRDELVCGREEIVPHVGEVPYDPSRLVWVNGDGSRHAAFVAGDEDSLVTHYASLGVTELLDAVSDVQRAEANDRTLEARRAYDTMRDKGFLYVQSVGRNDGDGSRDSL